MQTQATNLSTISAIRNALAALIGYPTNLSRALPRRLVG